MSGKPFQVFTAADFIAELPSYRIRYEKEAQALADRANQLLNEWGKRLLALNPGSKCWFDHTEDELPRYKHEALLLAERPIVKGDGDE